MDCLIWLFVQDKLRSKRTKTSCLLWTQVLNCSYWRQSFPCTLTGFIANYVISINGHSFCQICSEWIHSSNTIDTGETGLLIDANSPGEIVHCRSINWDWSKRMSSWTQEPNVQHATHWSASGQRKVHFVKVCALCTRVSKMDVSLIVEMKNSINKFTQKLPSKHLFEGKTFYLCSNAIDNCSKCMTEKTSGTNCIQFVTVFFCFTRKKSPVKSATGRQTDSLLLYSTSI